MLVARGAQGRLVGKRLGIAPAPLGEPVDELVDCGHLAGLQVSVPVTKLAKWKTTFQMVALGALILAGSVAHGGWEQFAWVEWVGLVSLWLAAGLTLITGWDYLRAGLSDMLASRFERIGALDLVRGENDGRGTTDPDEARALAEKQGADFVLYGSFTRFGQGASLDVQCAPVAGDETTGAPAPLREIFVHSGSIGEIIPDLDELAGKVSRYARGEMVVTGVPPATGYATSGAAAPGGGGADV